MDNDNDLENELYDDEIDDLDEDVDFDVGGNDLRSRGRQVLNAVGQQGRQRLGNAASRGKARVADRIDDFGDVVGSRISYSADYLRSNDIGVITDDLVDTVRRHPLLSAGIAIGAGYVAGKVIGIGGGSKSKKGKVGRKVRNAVVSSLAAMAATRLKDTLTSQVMSAIEGGGADYDDDDFDDDFEDAPPRRTRASQSRGGRSGGSRTGGGGRSGGSRSRGGSRSGGSRGSR